MAQNEKRRGRQTADEASLFRADREDRSLPWGLSLKDLPVLLDRLQLQTALRDGDRYVLDETKAQ